MSVPDQPHGPSASNPPPSWPSIGTPQYGYAVSPPTKPKRKVPVAVIVLIVIALLALLCCGGLAFFLFGGGDDDSGKPAPSPTRTTSSEPLAPYDQFTQDVKARLGNSNRGAAERVTISETNGIITVQIALQTSLTKGLIRLSAYADTLTVIKAAKNSGVPFTELTVLGTVATRDVYGNTTEAQVVQATYSAATVEKINTENIALNNVFEAADNAVIDPDF